MLLMNEPQEKATQTCQLPCFRPPAETSRAIPAAVSITSSITQHTHMLLPIPAEAAQTTTQQKRLQMA